MTVALGADRLRPRWQAEIGEPVVALDVLRGGRGEGAAFALGGAEGALAVFAADGQLRYRRDLEDGLLTVAAGPDGNRLVALGIGSRRMWDARDGSLLAAESAGWSAAAAWDNRSRAVAVADGRHVRVLDDAGNVRWSSPRLPSTVTDVVWPKGRLRVAASAYQGVTIVEPETDRVVETLSAPGAVSGLTASPNGRWVVGGCQDATLRGWKLAEGTQFQMWGFPATVSQLAFEDGGRWMACQSAEVLTCWDFSGAGPTGRAAAALRGHDDKVSAFAWLPGSRRTLVSGDEAGVVLIWHLGSRVAPGDELRPVGGLRDTDPVTALTTDSTGAVVVGRHSGRVDVLSLA